MSRLVSIFLAVGLSAAAATAGASVRLVRFETDINAATARRVLAAIDAADVARKRPGARKRDDESESDLVGMELAARAGLRTWLNAASRQASSAAWATRR